MFTAVLLWLSCTSTGFTRGVLLIDLVIHPTQIQSPPFHAVAQSTKKEQKCVTLPDSLRYFVPAVEIYSDHKPLREINRDIHHAKVCVSRTGW